MRWLAALAIMLLLALPAAANPLTGGDGGQGGDAGGRERSRPAAADEPSGGSAWLAPVGRMLVAFNRTANREIGRHMRAIRDGETAGPFLIALALAFGYGVLHALGPGHGKLVVVSYFLGREARIGRGLLMGLWIAVFHVLSAIVIVFLADQLLRRGFGGAPSEVPAVRLASYGLIFVIGAFMLWRAWRRAPHGHHHAACGCGASRTETGLLSLGVGIVPCTGAVLILLYALANDILFPAYLLVSSIALGMALTMGTLGLLSVLARGFILDRLGSAGSAGTLTRTLDFTAAFLVMGVGAMLLWGTSQTLGA